MITPRHTRATGDRGEEIALLFLKKKGFKLIERNFRCPIGEVDLIGRVRKTLVFVEVKLRNDPGFGPAALAVNAKKRRKILQVARFFLASRRLDPPAVRFDVVGVDRVGDRYACTHYPAAFDATPGDR
jgi:putative endonuclease